MDLKLDDFLYDLPANRIAKYPSQQRGDSKLLFYDRGKISHHSFEQISELLPDESLVTFNDTKVIPARIHLKKETGAAIEIFLLEPVSPTKVHEEIMNSRNTCAWKCMIGNAKKWKVGTSLSHDVIDFSVLRETEDLVTFSWKDITFSELLIEIGKIPLPPYIDRELQQEDAQRYQTIYSKLEGAVAAPTAGLHFTNEIINKIQDRDHITNYLTLHVSAGTFQPIKSQKITDHPMHNEQVWISKQNIEHLLSKEKVIAVGTTVMRTIESIYWYGVSLKNNKEAFKIEKEDPYRLKPLNKKEALEEVLKFMEQQGLEKIGGQTEIFIYPGYRFQVCKGLVTNYHLPGSTLILLVSAFIGQDWKRVYREALSNDYRFLSYGDSSLLLP